MKRLLAIFLARSILLSISACGKKINIQQPTSTNNISEITATVAALKIKPIS